MFMRSFLAVFLFSAVSAFAQESEKSTSRSEYLHQAAGGVFEVTPTIALKTAKVDYKDPSDNDSDSVEVPLTVKGEYGFSDLFSVGAILGVGAGVTNYDDCSSSCDDRHRGLYDPVLTANFRIPLGVGAVRFGTDLSFSLGDHKIEADGDSNLASGGTVLTPYAGYEAILGSHGFGGKLRHQAVRTDRNYSVEQSSGGTNKYKIKDGEQTYLDLFYEYSFPKIVAIGTALEFTHSAESKSGSTKNNDKYNAVDVNVYVPLRFNSKITLVPSLSFGSINNKSDTIKRNTRSSMGVYARFAF